jgi:hypothetical protein
MKKKTLTAIALLAGAVTGFSQGQIAMFDYGGSFAIQLFAQQFSVTPSSPGYTLVSYGGSVVGAEIQGNDASDDNPGTINYSSAPLGTGYDVELLGGPAGTSLSGLTPVPGTLITSWLTGSGAGYWNAPTQLGTIAGTTTTATVAIAAWNTEGGAFNTLAAAMGGGAPWGVSDPATTSALGFGSITPPDLPASLTSFSLLTPVPEPSTIALGIMGASAFLMRLRRKQ